MQNLIIGKIYKNTKKLKYCGDFQEFFLHEGTNLEVVDVREYRIIFKSLENMKKYSVHKIANNLCEGDFEEVSFGDKSKPENGFRSSVENCESCKHRNNFRIGGMRTCKKIKGKIYLDSICDLYKDALQ